ncbi:MAG TPA: glycosyltransferase family 2 protein [Candidatus Pelethenecus sp.]|nr:glycosyltransferase family 2 protein [Candidatus Pelethenecus sp.]
MKYIENKISVIMPAYNASKYIGKAIISVIKQNYSNLELIIIDDCSSDNTSEIIQQFQKNYENIVYIKMENNSGVAKTRNKGLSIASGQYIAFLDSDDVWLEDKLTKQINIFKENKGIPFTYTAINIINEKDEIVKKAKRIKTKATYKILLKNTYVATSTVIIDREVTGDFLMPLRKSAEDYSLWLMLLKNFGMAKGINEALVNYRKTENSLSANKMKEIKYFMQVQREDMHIGRIRVLFNTFCYILHAIKKHYF